MAQLRYCYAKGETKEEIKNNLYNSPLYKIGDCILVWVSEGDFWMLSPTDVDQEDTERREYERLKEKFEPTNP